ncbi:RNA polymerase sigma-70 factor, ECF subfamily [Sinosporangium album]|uniref:RNA polymerase sigma-70 factor, ECF subfamily n=1 Tax=Sinosporangium album TaxID=504805 RepID=A0A1G8KRY7_9ACTN|nr:RNA polymerase sigma factor [Sinosporangium album]SDI46235.1 RNA polymerase sigma-70 factor, ECF subfamily [Sinosporangium album]
MMALPRVSQPPHGIDDATLVEQSRRFPDRFAVLYDRYFPEIYQYVAGRLGTQVADDLAAETFLVAFRKQESFNGARGQVRTWLYGIATNLVAQHRRSEARRLQALQRTPVERVTDSGHEDLVAQRLVAVGARGQLASALEVLSEADRDVLLLTALAGLGYEEIAQALDIPPGTVGSRLNRARRKLRGALGGVNPLQEDFGDADG